MTSKHNNQPDKSQELLEIVMSALAPYSCESETFASSIINAFANIKTPTVNIELETKLHKFRLKQDLDSGVSIKPGNILLNWRKLIDKVPEIVLTGSGATNLWLASLAALQIWKIVWSNAQIELKPNHAVTIYNMWKHRDGKNKISEEAAYNHVLNYLREENMPLVTQKEFASIIDDLVKLQSIELNEGTIWLREWVSKEYY